MEHHHGFAGLAARYDGFIVDLWGVVHDGVAPYPGAVECLARLRDVGKPVVLLSNAPRRAHAAAAAMRGIGIADDLYTGLMTSGEVTHRLLRDRPTPDLVALGRRLYHLGPERDRSVFADLDVEMVARPEDATCLLNTGPDDTLYPRDPADHDDVLDACLRGGVPMLCANPDLEVIRGGRRVICGGALALRYAARGGAVIWVGKPDPAVYAPVLDMLALPRARVLAVGDALRTDIAGAVWVLGGIHAAELPTPAAVEAAAGAAGLAPKFTLPAFRW
jgi:HAD superfamily hydrolase (TIGR01459 family)